MSRWFTGRSRGSRGRGRAVVASATVTIPPLPTTGLLAQFDAAQGVTASSSRVSAWADQSGNGNNATQATTAEMPFSGTDYLGRPVVRFAAINTTSGTIGGSNTGNTQGTSMAFAGSHTFDARSYSAFFIGRWIYPSSVTLFSSAASTVGLLRGVNSTTVAQTLYAGARDTTIQPRMNPSIYGVTSSATAVTGHGNIQDVTGLAVITAGTGSGGTIGRLTSTSGYATFEALEVVIYDGALSTGNVAAVKAYAAAKYSLRTSDYTKFVAFEGDSITYGLDIPQQQSYPVKTMRSTTEDWRMLNYGSSGATLTTLSGRTTALDAQRRSGYSRNVLVVMIGRNDAVAAVAPDTYYANLITYVQARVTAGWEVWVGTCIATGNSTINTRLQDYNARIRGTTGGNGIVTDAGANRVIDFGALPEFDAQADSSNATYYQSDFTHPTDAGAALMADLVVTQLLT